MPSTSKGSAVVPPPVEERVIGHNHVRRTERDRTMDRIHRLQQVPRWQRRMRYRLVTSRRMRLICFLILICMGLTALLIMWFHDEPVAGMAVLAVTLGASVLGCFALEILIHCPKLTEGLLFHMGILERVWEEEEYYGANQEKWGRRRDHTVVLPKNSQYTFAVSEDGNHPQAQVEYYPMQDGVSDLEVGDGTLFYDPDSGVYFDESGNPYYADDADDGGKMGSDSDGDHYMYGSGEKPMWGDVAPAMHTIDAKLARVGQRARAGAQRLIKHITHGDATDPQQDVEEAEAILAEFMEDEEYANPPAAASREATVGQPHTPTLSEQEEEEEDEEDEECTSMTRDTPAPQPVDEGEDKLD